jgi:AraC-like DNA-binding protein
MLAIDRNSLTSNDFLNFRENDVIIEQTESEGFFHFNEVSFDALQFIRCQYQIKDPKKIQLNIEDAVLEMHFRLSGESLMIHPENINMSGGSHTLFYQQDNNPQIIMSPTNNGNFLEIRVGTKHFERLLSSEIPVLSNLIESGSNKVWPGNHLSITPSVYNVINEISNSPYLGKLNMLFLEAKMTELLLLQATLFSQVDSLKPFSFKNSDKIKFYEAQEFMNKYYMESYTIKQIASSIGINERKLTQGFKELFGLTIFEYINDLRMNKAKQLLLDEKKYVGEVSEMVGYKNQQHFTVAFKKKFGILPSKLKE